MPLVFAAATSHAPGITAWNAAAPAEQRTHVAEAFAALRAALERARPDLIVLFTSEHWTNFFLDHIGAFCVARGATFRGPTEPWLGIEPHEVKGEPAFAGAIVEAAYADEIEVSFSYECELDHGSILPLHFLTPGIPLPVVPIFFNTLASPQPSARRAYRLGMTVGALAARTPQRIAIVATGGMSHDPGERNHGRIDSEFDHRFLEQMRRADVDALTAYTNADFAAAGAGAFELLAWIALRGAIGAPAGEVLAYEAVAPWATGIGLMRFDLAATA